MCDHCARAFAVCQQSLRTKGARSDACRYSILYMHSFYRLRAFILSSTYMHSFYHLRTCIHSIIYMHSFHHVRAKQVVLPCSLFCFCFFRRFSSAIREANIAPSWGWACFTYLSRGTSMTGVPLARTAYTRGWMRVCNTYMCPYEIACTAVW